MDILGLSKQMFHQLGQMGPSEKTQQTNVNTEKTAPVSPGMSPLSERLDNLARQYDLKSMPISELKSLQTSLVDSGFIDPTQVRAQGLLPQLAYHHYEAGPMDVESALEEHLARLKDQPAVLADFNEGKHVLNVVRNLVSAREQQIQAA